MGGQRDGKKASGAEQHKVKFSMAKRAGNKTLLWFLLYASLLKCKTSSKMSISRQYNP